jgi:DNA-binding IclR family transcriptional regulator
MTNWRFLTNHALVLLHVAEHPNSTLREIALAAGITERAALSILRALEEDELISRRKEGRRNRYRVDFQAVMEHQLRGPYSVVELAEELMALARRLQGVKS